MRSTADSAQQVVQADMIDRIQRRVDRKRARCLQRRLPCGIARTPTAAVVSAMLSLQDAWGRALLARIVSCGRAGSAYVAKTSTLESVDAHRSAVGCAAAVASADIAVFWGCVRG